MRLVLVLLWLVALVTVLWLAHDAPHTPEEWNALMGLRW